MHAQLLDLSGTSMLKWYAGTWASIVHVQDIIVIIREETIHVSYMSILVVLEQKLPCEIVGENFSP